MNTQVIIATLDQEIARLQQARALLTSAAEVKGLTSIKRGPGRPKALTTVSAPKTRVLSADAKARIAAAQKARWAKARKVAKKAAKAEAKA